MADPTQKTDEKQPSEYMKENPFITLPLQAYKIRRNMLLCAILCAFQALYGLLDGTFTVIGNNLGFPWPHFDFILLAVALYFTSYFFMLGRGTLMKWRLRSTGEPDSIANTIGNKGIASKGTNGIEVSQTTAWQTIDSIFGSLKRYVQECLEVADYLSKRDLEKDILSGKDQRAVDRLGTISGSIGVIKTQLVDIDDRLIPALVAFDKEFWAHQKNSWRNFYIWEFYGPLALSCLAIMGLTLRIVFYVFLRCPAVT
nr:hypothetical protein [Pseudodesulfovibrio sp.]